MTFFAGQKPGADKLYALSYADTYVPALTATTTDPNLGADGTAVGAYHRNGLFVTGWAQFLFSGSGLDAGSGPYIISLPLDADVSIMQATEAAGAASILGGGFIRDDSTNLQSELVQVQLITANVVRLRRHNATTAVTSSDPFTWAEGDRISINFSYLADPAGLSFGT